MLKIQQAIYPVFILLIISQLFGGCAGTSPQAAFEQVRTDLEERGINQIHWYTDTEEDRHIAEAMEELLEQELTAESAVRIALLNNRRLQAAYQGLGVAQADLVQAGLLENPAFTGTVFPSSDGPAGLDLHVTQNFLQIFYIPLRKRIAESMLEEAKINVTSLVLDLEYDTRIAFYQTQAGIQLAEMFEQVNMATELGYDFAKRLYEAGNITDLELNRHRVLYEQTRVDLRSAEADLVHYREELNQLMGLYGEQIKWDVVSRLADIPDEDIDLDQLEARVVENSLQLKLTEQRIITAGRALGLSEATRWMPWLEIGVEAERSSDWEIGPRLSLPIPLFDRGQAHVARSHAELKREKEFYTAHAVEIRSIARQYRNQLEKAEDTGRHYKSVILPLRERITNETQLQYNAMQVGLFDLLRAREQQIEAGKDYIMALYEYWSASAAIEQLLRGRVPHPF